MLNATALYSRHGPLRCWVRVGSSEGTSARPGPEGNCGVTDSSSRDGSPTRGYVPIAWIPLRLIPNSPQRCRMFLAS